MGILVEGRKREKKNSPFINLQRTELLSCIFYVTVRKDKANQARCILETSHVSNWRGTWPYGCVAKNRMPNNYTRTRAACGKIKSFQLECQSAAQLTMERVCHWNLRQLRRQREASPPKHVRLNIALYMKKSRASSLQDQRLKNKAWELLLLSAHWWCSEAACYRRC